jgi:hypothetical protein
MPNPALAIPHVRACAWFEEDPLDPHLAPGSGGFLDLAWGKPDLGFLEPMQKRRMSPLARGFFHCAQRLCPPDTGRVVFASRHGEVQRTLSILHDLVAEKEVSPTLFSMAVHNAVPGLWSIFKGNRAPLTAVAAGPETFGWGLVEAIGAHQADPGSPVLYVYADERLPEPWAEGAFQTGLHAVAILLGAQEGPALTLLREPSRAETSSGPQSHHFLRAWRGGESAWEGSGSSWHWQFA